MFNPLLSLFNSLLPFCIGALRWRILEKNYDKPLMYAETNLKPFSDAFGNPCPFGPYAAISYPDQYQP